MASRGYILVVTPDREAAPTVLFFGGLAASRPGQIRIAQYRRDAMAAALGGASAVVFVRGLPEFADLVLLAERLGVPRYYFVDDHFMVIREQGGDAAAFARDHSQATVAGMLTGFGGVLVSTERLAADFRQRAIHERLELFPPVAIAAVPRRGHGNAMRIGFFGGSHLHAMLHSTIVPAARELAASRPVTLVVVGGKDPIAESPGLTVEHLPYQRSYLDGVRALGQAGVTVLAHPMAPGLPSNPYKNPHALITAEAIGAVPVVSDTPPYASLRDRGIAILCADDAAAWHDGLGRAADESAALSPRLSAYCRSEFSGRVNQQAWDDMLAAHSRPSIATVARRTVWAATTLFAGRVGRGVRRVAEVAA